jgi:ABC-type lipoprotein export system ATPase subunit
MEITNTTFQNGSVWLKTDFHLHTKADKEWEKTEREDPLFLQKYIEQLKNTNTSIGVITNHNKFDLEEYKNLRKKAKKENIYLLPGVELSVNDGANGIHCLITFEYESWVKNDDNFIDQFLNSAFEGIGNRENENTRCNYSLSDLLRKIEEHRKSGRDSFITMAHIEQKSGFYNEFDGAEGDIPVLVEGSDCKKLDEVGFCGIQKDETGNDVEKESWLKIGDFNFEAIKYALTDKENRVASNYKKNNNSFIKSISFEGGLLEGTEIGFSPELNNFIGIRGSGKSSILEIIRYTLGISLGNQVSDKDYKDSLIEHVLRSGGKVIITVVDRLKKEYRIEKIYGQKEDIYIGSERIDVPNIDTIFSSPVYFGQKDLSNKDIDFEADLVRKLIGSRLESIKTEISKKDSDLRDVISQLRKLKNLDELKKEIKASIADAEYKLQVFKEKGIEGKLKLQSKFDTDISRYKAIVNELSIFQNNLVETYTDYKPFFSDTKFISEGNKDIYEQADIVFRQMSAEFDKIGVINQSFTGNMQKIKALYSQLLEKKETLKEEFAKIKREIDVPNLNPDDFLKLNRTIETSKLKLVEIEKSEKKKAELQKFLNDKVTELNNLWHKEFQILKKEVARINEYDNNLSIEVNYKGRNDVFYNKLQSIFKGSGIRGGTYETIKSEYKDFIDIYRDYANLNSTLNISESLIAEFKNRFTANLEELLTFRIHDRFIIKYNEKPLKDHSLGQRATALILFLLAQKETDVLIIDQPEDDLDNQTIYEDVIKEIKGLKGDMQFIFATHNANIPVLGDSEKIVSCEYIDNEKIEITAGTIDNPEIQKQIVTIMEGGKEAFKRRKNIYSIWNIDKRN